MISKPYFQQYKQDAKIAQESLASYTNLENEYEKLHKTVRFISLYNTGCPTKHVPPK